MFNVRESRRFAALMVVSVAGIVLSRWVELVGA